MIPSNLHVPWARLFVRAVASAGVTSVVLSPGSRSTPLAIAAATEPSLSLHVIVDERAAAFFALGQARVTGRPSMLVCTSGTAVAHYLPAIIEAHQTFLPLLVVTADRPWELYDTAAPQTIDQSKIFGGMVQHFAELGLPDPAPGALRAVPRIAAQAVARTLGPTPGVVHINARFRKPVDPVNVPGREVWEDDVDELMARGAPRVHLPDSSPDETAIFEITERVLRAFRGLIVCGPAPLGSSDRRDALLALARRTGFPLLAEATSQVRFGGDRAGIVTVGFFDALLRNPGFRARNRPDLILQFGLPPTSSGYADFLAESPCAHRVVIHPYGWNDPQSSAAALVFADPAHVARRVLDRLPDFPCSVGRSSWAEIFRRESDRVASIVDEAVGLGGTGLSEAAIARAVVAASPADAVLVIGNSTPVRDIDAYCPPSSRPLRVIHQRGASGIDGLVAGTAGARSVADGPVVLVLGDVSLLHDIGALRLVAQVGLPVVMVVVQNGGGRIFEHLPIVHRIGADLFEQCFATRQDVDFAHAAAAFGIEFERVGTHEALLEALARGFSRPSPTLIEAIVPPHEGAALAARIRTAVGAELTNV